MPRKSPNSRSGPSQRQLRVGEAIRHAIVRVLREGNIRDPELDGALVTVTEVRASPDLKHASAFVTPLGGGDSKAMVKALNRAAPYIRSVVAREVQLRTAPGDPFPGRYLVRAGEPDRRAAAPARRCSATSTQGRRGRWRGAA